MSTVRQAATPGAGPAPRRHPLVIAHRGDSMVAPENTLPAFAAAVRGGADMIEIDLHCSADGEGVVIHDATVDRTTDASGAVADLDAAEIGRFDAGSWFDPAFGGVRIPLFGEILDLLGRSPGTELLLELKDPWPAGPLGQVLADLQAAGLADRVIVQSFFPDVLTTVRRAAPDVRMGFLSSRFDDEVVTLSRHLGAVACNPAFTRVLEDPGLVTRAHRAGLQVMVWTANEVAQWERLVAAGVDGIITDRPDRLRGFLDYRHGP
ncbi:glycerophosphodiester phosphodiesterase [Pseudactinotalea sp. Z1739]|uniref:glycerophosphodiester phosphodiesterase n=1 Tax=Pseudactinotalea sp. Z1739 TaxID=3413028 RepID=UPI003C7BFBBB